MELIIVLVIVGLIIAGAAWMMLDAWRARHALGEHPGSFAPYKIEAPNETSKDVAISEFDAKSKMEGESPLYDRLATPKRKYTKRSKYWATRGKRRVRTYTKRSPYWSNGEAQKVAAHARAAQRKKAKTKRK